MVSWRVVFSKQAEIDAQKLAAAGLKDKALALLEVLVLDPYAHPPRCEQLVGDLMGPYSRRINIQHRLVYEILADIKTVRILRMWSHYE